MRAKYAQCSESSKFLETSLRVQGGGGGADGLMRLVCTWAAQVVIEQEAVEQVEQDEQAEQEAADTEVDTEEDEEDVEQVVVAAAAPPAPATRVMSARIQALYDYVFDD